MSERAASSQQPAASRGECPGSRYLTTGRVHRNEMPSPERCPYCDQMVAVRKNGRLRAHVSREAVPA